MSFSLFSKSVADNLPASRGGAPCARRIEKYRQAMTGPSPASNGGDPRNWRMERHRQVGYYLVACIVYPDAKNYEGRKVMIFRCTLKDLEAQGIVDPHFCDNPDFISPVARFVPDEFGWAVAVKTAQAMDEIEWSTRITF